mmetsp:Transcript_38013/g.112948  ORF Transcript_38013/g.112948 Transcript_38013/m.112948 type:complete len:222 (+) Transcript_38013:610-1275(+)
MARTRAATASTSSGVQSVSLAPRVGSTAAPSAPLCTLTTSTGSGGKPAPAVARCSGGPPAGPPPSPAAAVSDPSTPAARPSSVWGRQRTSMPASPEAGRRSARSLRGATRSTRTTRTGAARCSSRATRRVASAHAFSPTKTSSAHARSCDSRSSASSAAAGGLPPSGGRRSSTAWPGRWGARSRYAPAAACAVGSTHTVSSRLSDKGAQSISGTTAASKEG